MSVSRSGIVLLGDPYRDRDRIAQGKVQNGTKKKSTEAAPKPRTSSGDGPPGGEVRKSSRPRKAKVWFEEGADATEEGADPVKYVGNNLDGEDVDNQKHEDEAEANGKSEGRMKRRVTRRRKRRVTRRRKRRVTRQRKRRVTRRRKRRMMRRREEQDDEVEEEEDEESEEGQGDEDEAEKGSEKGDSAEVGEGADAHKPQITRKGSFDEMLEEQGDADDEDMEDEAVAEERAMLLGKLKALDEIKEPVNTGEVSAKPKSTPTAAGAGTSGGKAKAGAGASGVKAKAGAGASGVKAKAGAGTSGVKAKAGAGTSGVKAKAGAGAKTDL
ncbi:unnamed protein product [Closterium sp. NIES-64]|nr:unnamed protein product [Closterium sp. NIES-64]